MMNFGKGCPVSVSKIMTADLAFVIIDFLERISDGAIVFPDFDIAGYFGVREHSVRSNRATSSEK